MANDRLWLICKHCKKEVLLAKYYPIKSHSRLWSAEHLVVFIETHIEHSPNFGHNDLNGDTCFEIGTDSTFESDGVEQ